MQSSDQHGTLMHGFCAAHENMHRNCAIVHFRGGMEKFRLYYGSQASLPGKLPVTNQMRPPSQSGIL